MDEKTKQAPAAPHYLILEARGRLTVTGVRRVVRCDPDSAAIEVGEWVLNLSGAGLSVTALDLDRGEVRLSGRIDALEYAEARSPGGVRRRLAR